MVINGNIEKVIKVLLSVCFLLTVQNLYANQTLVDFKVADAPDWVESIVVVENASQNKKKGAVVYNLVDFQNRITEGDFISFSRYIVRPLNSNGVEDMGNITIEFNPDYEKLTIHSVKITRDNQTSNHLKPGGFN